MRCLIVDQENMGLDLVLRAVAAGHEVRWAKFAPRKPIRDGEGFKGFTIVDDWRDSMEWLGKDGLAYLTGNFRFLWELDRYREFGFNIFGPTVASARLEIERGYGMEVMQSVGIEVPPYQEFASLEDAAKFARKSDKQWVFKVLGSESDKALSYVADDAADLTGWIERKIARGLKLKGPCMLQERIDMLAEVGVSGWFGADGFLPGKWQACFEHKKAWPGEVGPNTGEMGTITQYCETDKLADQMLKPLEPILQALGHRGDFAIGCGIDKQGRAWPFEYTARAGWPCAFIQWASHRGDPIAWMMNALKGKDTLRVSSDVAVGVVIGQPRFPFQASPEEMVVGNPISGLDEVWSDFHPVSIMKGRGPQMEGGKVVDGDIYMTSGEYVGVVTALGRNVRKARAKCYDTVSEIHLSDMIFRDDIGEKLEPVLPELHRHGYCLDMEW